MLVSIETAYAIPIISSEEGVVAGHIGQFTPGGFPRLGYLSTL